ncbi:putative profilin II [Melanomma pulvis-pyrius CBS 109.77]|uniref:Profilin n=1 Tax=Melanomma pulvis-pyrius CBS 109.77 TaxID=1314802 RepID=A0A6A6XGT8_9PLEO|nr:putative profilin II [Melanomma pulvis-pyrius CBS 109.77]
MSWQAYVDQSLVGTGNIDKAIICGASDKAVWAASPGFSMPADELQVIIDSFTDSSSDPNHVKKVISQGVKVNGEKYMTIESTDSALKAKKGKEGLIVIKTKQALLIAHHPAEIQTPPAFSSVSELADYLIKVGY